MALKHLDVCTHINNPEDIDILTRKGFDVNLRLMKTSPPYRAIIESICDYIKWGAMTEKEGYRKPYGYSGANAGIPLNVICDNEGLLMINPHIIEHSENTRVTRTDCGSLTLGPEGSIFVKRWARVRIEYWDIEGNRHEVSGYYPTEQHEIDHNNGILITDREVGK